MLLSAVSVLVVAQSSSEIPEGIMNNLVQKINIASVPNKSNLEKFYQFLPKYFKLMISFIRHSLKQN